MTIFLVFLSSLFLGGAAVKATAMVGDAERIISQMGSPLVESSLPETPLVGSSLLKTPLMGIPPERVPPEKVRSEKTRPERVRPEKVPPERAFVDARNVMQSLTLPRGGKKACLSKDVLSSGKCPSSLLQEVEKERVKEGKEQEPDFEGAPSRSTASQTVPSSATGFLVFVSQSMPAASIRSIWRQVHLIGGRVLFRGLIGGTFKETQRYIEELGIVADIDPPKFDEYRVAVVPTFVLFRNDIFDKVSGHISIFEVLEQLGKKGDLREDAQRLSTKLKEGRGKEDRL